MMSLRQDRILLSTILFIKWHRYSLLIRIPVAYRFSEIGAVGADDLDGLPFLFRHSNGSYALVLKELTNSGEHNRHFTWKNIGSKVGFGSDADTWNGECLIACTGNDQVINLPPDGSTQGVVQQQFKLKLLAKPGDSDNIYPHMLLTAPAPSLKNWHWHLKDTENK
ncbi:uncharacterized protein DFL_007636 [Arthrobotrys flagrans]|uniref:Uncharacterized protein n=1 Tax=Arthrobotrys flagrans TaxID=97331 RepID=A0A436ZWB9_ARTFL|nr:hypothetical protein DFL_007636 [Arthrobotrys flagrans]